MSRYELPTIPKVERNQSFYHLSCIQNVGKSVPSAILVKLLLDQYGAGTTICSILVGNLILWILGLTIVSMVYQEHTNAIENVEGYLGKYAGIAFSFTLIASFMAWYVNQISDSIITLKSIPQFNNLWQQGFDIRIGAVLGLLSAILAIGGIRLLKALTAATFPLLTLFYAYVIYISSYSPTFAGTWGLSASAIIMVVLLNLPGVINLPTFFRHSRSRADSFLALSFMAVFMTFFECATIWMDFPALFELITSKGEASNLFLHLIPFTFFILLTYTCSNLLNIYLASACYESFIPKFRGTKGLVIMGLLGTAAYTFIQISTPIIFSINLLNSYIAVLGTVLSIAVIVRLVVKHRPRNYDKPMNFTCWLIGSIVSTYFHITNPDKSVSALFYGMCTSAMFFLALFFLEEMTWSAQQLKSKKQEMG